MWSIYISCIGGQVALSLRRWELMSLRRHMTSTFNTADIKVKECDSFIGTATLKPKIERYASRKNLSWLFGKLMMPNNDCQTDFSICTSHPWNILIISNRQTLPKLTKMLSNIIFFCYTSWIFVFWYLNIQNNVHILITYFFRDGKMGINLFLYKAGCSFFETRGNRQNWSVRNGK